MKAAALALALALWLAPARAEALLCVPILGCSCNVAATDIEFDQFNPLAGPQAAVGEISVTCSGVIDVSPSVRVRLGAGQWGALSGRKMRAAGGDLLDYNIYTTQHHAVVWGDGSPGAPWVTVSGGVITVNTWSVQRTAYARATPVTTTRPGDYSDTVIVQIEW